MTNTQALKALLAKVEAGEWDCLSEDFPLQYQVYANFGRAYDGSLDAAQALLSATLPGWLHVWGVDHEGPFAYLHQSGPDECDITPGEECRAKNEARALLIAIIKKPIEQEG